MPASAAPRTVAALLERTRGCSCDGSGIRHYRLDPHAPSLVRCPCATAALTPIETIVGLAAVATSIIGLTVIALTVG